MLGGLLGTIDLTIPVAVGSAVFLACCLVAAITLRGELMSQGQPTDLVRQVDVEAQ